MQPWESAARFLEASVSSAESRVLGAEARGAILEQAVDHLILKWSKTQLLEAVTERDLILFQAMVASVLQLRNCILGNINSKSEENQGERLQSGSVVEPTFGQPNRSSNYFAE